MRPICIIGAGQHGRTVLSCVKMSSRGVARFVDRQHDGTTVDGAKCLGGNETLDDPDFLSAYDFIVGIGDNRIRGELSRKILERGGTLVTVVHPAAVLLHNVQIGVGTVVMPGAVVSTGCRVGKYCVINIGANLGHDAVMRDGSQLADMAFCATEIGQEALVGVGAIVLPGRARVGTRAVVGAGSVVIQDVEPDTTVFGNPATVIKQGGTHGNPADLSSDLPTTLADWGKVR